MAFRFTIGRRISLGFSIVIISTIVAFIYTNNTFNKSREINNAINNIYNPSVANLQELKLLTVRSKMLIYNWVNFQSSVTNPDKIKLNKLQEEEYPRLRARLDELSSNWESGASDTIHIIFDDMTVLFESHEIVKQFLPDFESYNDPNNKFVAQDMVDQGGEIYVQTDDILEKLDDLIRSQEKSVGRVTDEMLASFDLVQLLMRNLGIALALAGILIGLLTTRSIVKPVGRVKYILLDLSRGIFPNQENWIQASNDEIGEMTVALQKVVAGLKQTKDFAEDVGSGRFDTKYEPLSDDDMLGHALLRMREELAENERILEEKVRLRTAEVVAQKEEIEAQSQQIEELYNQTTDSILYAKRIQDAILPSNEEINKHIKDALILFKPKDIVSGDFYWFSKKDNKAIIAAADCTGHGVPGAFMSMIGSSLLNEIVNEKAITSPGDILMALRQGVIKSLGQSGESGEAKDGMDIALCAIDEERQVLEYSGAYNPLYIVRNGEISEVKADRQPVGIHYNNQNKPFTNHEVPIEKGDAFYIFSDGYIDQFGGPNGKKFKWTQFKEVLLRIQDKTMDEQREILNQTIEDWMGDEQQIDDILVIGLRF